ncbi:hypothetical protein [Curtobacterium sp. MCSS17_016]|uniref:hypothetical protein n=1 Tax=Curtobacterium sp. MCSS17_016 TaxID=2175644 RepID=UPI0011B712F8|nr:hypothetical protein [Curtobacterium sp. MCSS17_016]WIE81348.1 hypothetical protein DEJ19_019125 [Curtobacterium sp. MCSS17_016]
MAHPMTVAHLFLDEPQQWGLRGDPWLWRAMRDRLEDVPLPTDVTAMMALLEEAFAAETGVELADAEAPVFVERFAHGGMSSGRVDPAWWRDTGFRRLLKRWTAAVSR